MHQIPAAAARFHLPAVLLLAGLGLAAAHLWLARPALEEMLPATVYEYEVELGFEGFGSELRVATYLPASGERQTVLEERFESAALAFDERTGPDGRLGEWSGQPEGLGSVIYTAQISTRAQRYEIPAGLGFGAPLGESARGNLEETEAMPYRHREIRELWSRIRPRTAADLRDTLAAIFRYTHDDIEPAPFKGFTDALTALRLGQASCNGKSRLFVALARLNGIPSRLVGGVILDTGVKRTSHQWVEALVGGRWVPFDPLNGHFAEIPANYLELYRGDEFLFKHTRDINFDYAFRIRRLLAVSTPEADGGDAAAGGGWLGGVTRFVAANRQLSEIFLLFPLAALVVTFCRNVTGLRTFGIFLPMLVGAGCRYTGLVPGLVGFIAILGVGAAAHRSFRGMRVLLVPRIAAVITLLTGVILAGGALVADSMSHRVALLALFPVVILSFAAERLQQMAERSHLRELLAMVAWTVGVTLLCYWVFSSVLLRGLFFRFPELLLVVLAAQLAVGRWTGIRALEYRRFLRLFRAAGPADAGVLGLNARNIDFIGRLNLAHWMAVADDKPATKRHLDDAGVPTPRTLLTVESAHELDHRHAVLDRAGAFALKPAAGSQGKGIVLVAAVEDGAFRLVSGELWPYARLRAQVHDITRGLFSTGDDPDRALFEELIRADAFSRALAPRGIPDIRVLVVRGTPVAAMLRVPTRQSGGKANLHQGAAGFGVDLASGRVAAGIHEGRVTETHPDTGETLAGREVPGWARVLEVARGAQRAVPLGYVGVDICLDEQRGPVVIEVNARPGIEIQNALQKGLLPELERALAGGAA